MRLKVYVNDTDMTAHVQAQSVEISQSITDRVSQAQLSFIAGGADPARYDTATYDSSVYGVDVRELYEIRVEEHGTGRKMFAGTIRTVSPERKRKDAVFLNCQCVDWSTLLDDGYIEQATFTGKTDREIIQALIGMTQTGLTALTANIADTITIPFWEVKEKTLRQALDELVEFTGNEWRIDWDKNLKYFQPTTFPAPFGFSNLPNYTTTFPIDAKTSYRRDAVRLVNRCTVLGAVQPGGQRLKVTHDDLTSQSAYGVRPLTLVDDQITVGTIASLKAKSVVDENAWPLESITLTTPMDGLEAGMLLPVKLTSYQLNGSYIIREVRMRQRRKTITEYSLTLGARIPDTLRLLKQIDARSRRNTGVPTAKPADGTVTDASIGLPLTATSIGSVNATTLIGAINAGNIASVNAAVIAGVLHAGQIGTVNAGSIQGAIISSQVADNLIDRLSLLSEPLRWIPNLSSDPFLPDVNYPDGAFYRRTTDDQFRKNAGGVWINATESEAITGKMAFHSIGTLRAGSIIGLIAAGQIGSVNASSITGAINAANIASVNASAIQGTLTASQIGTINASSVVGSFTSGQISSVNVGSLVGQISGTQIASATISGTNIGSLTINASNIQDLTITGAKVADNTLTDAKFLSISASKITGGTISATINITSPVINGGTITGVSLTTAATSSGSVFSATSGGIQVYQSSNVNNNLQFNHQFFQVVSGGSVRVQLTTVSSNGRLSVFGSGGAEYFGVDPSQGITPGGSWLAASPTGYLRLWCNGSIRSVPYF